MQAGEVEAGFDTRSAAYNVTIPQRTLSFSLQAFASGDVRVWNEFYASDSPPPPILRNDGRWQPARISVRRPRCADLERVMNAISYGSTDEGLTLRR